MSGSERLIATNPATSETLAEVASTTAQELEGAVARATEAARGWSRLGPRGRRSALRRLADGIGARAREIALLDARNSGNPLHSMEADVAKAIEYLHYYAELGTETAGRLIPLADDRHATVSREPYGVVGVITAYNHPFYFSITKTAAALAAGNAVIVKPPEQAPLSSLLLADLVRDALPPGVFTVLPGGAEVGAGIVRHSGIPRVSFTGGIVAGRAVLAEAGRNLKVATVELGGKNAFIAYPDVDISAAARAVTQSLNLLTVAGQSCSSTSLLLAHASIHDDLVSAVRAEFDRVPIDLPESAGVHMGCLISMDHRAAVHDFVAGSVAEGAAVLTGGQPLARFPAGAFYPPTLLADVRPDMRVAREEVFGPVLAVLRWTSEDDAVAIVNGTGYGMTANVWSADRARAYELTRRLRVGYAWINAPVVALPVGVPFGGVRNSGTARDHSIEELQSFTYQKMTAAL